MPDNDDYAWLGWLVGHPDEWTDQDLSAAELMLANQRTAMESYHPKDVTGRQRAQIMIDELESAIAAHRLGRSPVE